MKVLALVVTLLSAPAFAADYTPWPGREPSPSWRCDSSSITTGRAIRGQILRQVVGAREFRIHQRRDDGFDDGLPVGALAIVLRLLLARANADAALDALGDQTGGLDVAAAGQIDGAGRQHYFPKDLTAVR